MWLGFIDIEASNTLQKCMAHSLVQQQNSLPARSADDLFKTAAAHMGRQEYARAAEIYRSMLWLSPDNLSCWLNLGTALRSLGHLEASAACTKRAIELAPDNP